MGKVVLDVSTTLDGFTAGRYAGKWTRPGNCSLCFNVPAAAAAAY
jgi:hypothetical protein